MSNNLHKMSTELHCPHRIVSYFSGFCHFALSVLYCVHITKLVSMLHRFLTLQEKEEIDFGGTPFLINTLETIYMSIRNHYLLLNSSIISKIL